MPLTRRQIYGIKNSLTAAERDLIAYYELCWQLRSMVPTVDQVVAHMRKKRDRISHISVNHYLSRQPVIKALENRGIPFRQHSQEELTPQQIAAATVACNFADQRSLHTKLDEIGVKSATYQAWLLDPLFKNFVKTVTDRNLENIDPVAKTEYMRLIASGNWNAIKYYLDVTAAAQNNETPQTEHLLRAMLEVIQSHIKDPQLLDAIGRDLLKVAQNKTMEITSYVVEESEVLEASRKLGI